MVDFFFFIDIIYNFNTWYEDEDLNEVLDRKLITKRYIKGWFMIDVVSILPFDILLDMGPLNKIARVARIGKVFRIVKLTKLLRLLKINKKGGMKDLMVSF